MREIKFRAWNKKYRTMDDEFYIHSNGSQYDLAERNYNTPHIEIEKTELELMQYTGLKDKNGVEIYEGDICIVDEGLSDYLYVVEWVYGGFQAVTYKKKDSSVRGIADGMNSFYIEPNEASVMTVIGNIHEDPELLEVQNG